jgi:hypothetical protein
MTGIAVVDSKSKIHPFSKMEDNPHVASSLALHLCDYCTDRVWRTGLTLLGDSTPRGLRGNSPICLHCGVRGEDSSGEVLRALQTRNLPAQEAVCP